MLDHGEKLIKKIKEFSPNEITALGPAAYLAFLMLEKAPVGSQIVICTDGMANLGLGNLQGGRGGSGKDFYV